MAPAPQLRRGNRGAAHGGMMSETVELDDLGRPVSDPDAPKPEGAVEPIQKRFTRALPCRLTVDELVAKASELSSMLEDYDQMLEEHGAEKARQKEEEKALDAAIRSARRVLISRYEQRVVDCEVRVDYDDGKARTFRLDTDEMIDERTMTPEERQTSFVQ